jgi:hypothetical protein
MRSMLTSSLTLSLRRPSSNWTIGPVNSPVQMAQGSSQKSNHVYSSNTPVLHTDQPLHLGSNAFRHKR